MTFCFTLHSKSLSRIHVGNTSKTGTVKIRDTETEGGGGGGRGPQQKISKGKREKTPKKNL